MKKLCLLTFFLFFSTFYLVAQTTLSGKITDSESGEPLIGATLQLQGTSEGVVTNDDGQFSIESQQPLPWNIKISYTGYTSKTLELTAAQADFNVQLSPSVSELAGIEVLGTRGLGKVQDAPSSLTVIPSRKLEASPNNNPVRNLVNAPGLYIQQQSAGRINVQLRGDGGLFGSASFPMQDYRSLSGPGLGTFDNLNSPISNLDLDRIEVVRGPGSALYGPGVTAGIIHFITKSAIDQPGTGVEIIGGNLNTYGASIRHATKISDKLGFKINAVYKIGDEFTLDLVEDAAQIAKLRNTVRIPGGETLLEEKDLDPDGDGNPMQDFWNQFILNGTLEFRPEEDFSMVLSGGTNSASAVFYNNQGEGLSQSTEYWGQARLQKGGLFAQAFYLHNNGGTNEKPTFLYQTGNRTGIVRSQLEAQLQYSFKTPNFLNTEWTTGLDYRLSQADSRMEVYGRNEMDDDYNIVGAYAQGKFELLPQLDLVVAGRVDRFNFFDEITFSPRAVAVYKPSAKHTFRGGYNRAVATPSQLQINVDFPVSTPIPGAFDIWLVGNKEAQTFGDNPQIVFNGVLPFPSLPVGTPGLPLAYLQGAVSPTLLPFLAEGIVNDAPNLAQYIPAINAFFADPANAAPGTVGQWQGYNIFNGQALGLVDAPQATLRKEDTWEVGYKGLIKDKLSVAIDVYHRKIDGATLFTAISPTYTLVELENVGTSLADGATANFASFLDELLKEDYPVEAQRAALVEALSTLYYDGYASTSDNIFGPILPILATTPTQNVPQNGVTHVAAGYRTFEAYHYWGTDVGLEYYINENFSIFGNYSWISENEFTPEIKGTDGATETTVISAPKNKFRLGLNYAAEYGIRANLSFQHDDEFEAILGQFSGTVTPRNLVDLGIGYKLKNNLSIGLAAQNLFNSKYRAFPNFPEIGRMWTGNVRYEF